MPLKISLIIPTLNRCESLSLAVQSALSQSQPLHEIIVVDDGSEDGTTAHIKKHFPTVTLITQTNNGVSHARNTGIKQATGHWIAFLDSDDQWFTHKVETQANAILANPNYRLCHCDEHWIRNGKRVNPMNKHKKRGGDIFEQSLHLCAISPSATIIKKELLDEVGLFDESLPACEDYDLWLRICANEPVLYIDEALLQKTGGHEDQLSKKYWGMDRFRLQALAKLLRQNVLSETQTALTLAVFEQKFNILCQGAIKRGNAERVTELEALYNDITALY